VVPEAGLDAEKLRLLNEWAEGLQRDERAEVAAAGRAILMLVEEVERLHVLLWDKRLNPEPPSETAPEPVPAAVAREAGTKENGEPELELHQSLRSRLRARWPGASLHS
jgi:hypothetical protein